MVHSTLSQTITKLPPTSALCTFHFLSAAFGGDRQKVGWETEREGEVREKEREKHSTFLFLSVLSVIKSKVKLFLQNNPPSPPVLTKDWLQK